MNIKVPKGDPVFDHNATGKVLLPFQRGQWDKLSGQSPSNPRIQVNSVTAWMDGSSIYGPSSSWSDFLRNFSGGLLTSGSEWNMPNQGGGRNFMWSAPDPSTGEHGPQGLYELGNAWANENLFTAAEGIIWFRYHNYIATKLHKEHPEWSDEKLFQNARKTVVATFQLCPARTLLNNACNLVCYQKFVDPGISPEFQAAAIRFGITMAPPGVYMRLFTDEEIQTIRNVTYRDVLIAVTCAEPTDLQSNVFLWMNVSFMVACLVACLRKYRYRKFQRRKGKAGDKTEEPTLGISAYEWQGHNKQLHPVSVEIENRKVQVFDRSGAMHRSLSLRNQDYLDVFLSSNHYHKALLLKVPKEYDLVMFTLLFGWVALTLLMNCRSFIEISNGVLSKAQAEDGIKAMMQAAGFDNKEKISWRDFHSLLKDHEKELQFAQLNVKGMEKQGRKRLSRDQRVSFILPAN
ncbi:hypothetical protein GOODEAATRI_000793, partial [Goodea atripinnis]